MMHIDHAAFMDGGGDFLLQGLDELPPGDDGVTMGTFRLSCLNQTTIRFRPEALA
ncbi:hypothetical protein GH808_07555 [Acetobacterium fimetarium]|uniref:Uncharacterized protein n=1 Tax=Acetobacterium fimetarium TaxID=52691 RepID=A0ABR6WUK7_9FIRM|nr:hypothetical protein [Acetobacterium fimetarium]MBC3804287.1 hypothetical protein [Acetobacterium fimetarium]